MKSKLENTTLARAFTLLVILAHGLICARYLTAQSKTKTVIAGERYANAAGGQAWLLGEDYRDLWAAPIDVEVLDLQSEGGGLRPVMRVGGMQTLGLALKGRDGRDYTFRAVDKSVAGIMPEEFQDTAIEDIAQDQIAASVPGAEIIVAPLAEAVGVLHVESRLVVMPDDPALGEYQKDFAEVLGILMEYPGAVSETNPGFENATEIIAAMDYWKRRTAGPEALADSRAFLRARLLDIFIGDWDRHRKQWRWARIPGKSHLQPIPEDRDQAFTDFEGFVLDLARTNGLYMSKFEKDYPPIWKATNNGWDLDRFLLTDLEKSEWMEIARDVQSRVTDEVIEAAFRRMPPQYYELRGSELEEILKARRNKLVEEAKVYYHHLAGLVDIQCSNKRESVVVERFNDGEVDVTVAVQENGTGGEPYYHRRFKPSETKEVRIYLQGGNDHVTTRGFKKGPIRIRVIGGPGNDVVDDSQGGGVDFYDFEGNDRIVGSNGTDLDTRTFVMPVKSHYLDEVPWVPTRDWGRFTKPLFMFGFHPDSGLILGAGFDSMGYGFRKYPYANRHILTGGFAFGVKEPVIDYKGEFRRENGLFHFGLHARWTGVEQLRYYGLGNETTNDQEEDVYMISNRLVDLFPAVEISQSRNLAFMIGPLIKYSDSTGTDPDTILGQEQPYGDGKFGAVGAQTRLRFTTREPNNVFAGGIEGLIIGSCVAEAWDVVDDYGHIDGFVWGHIPLGDNTLISVRGGGKKIWGPFPYFDAAYIGGGKTTHGLNFNRFAGDTSFHAGIVLRRVIKKISGVIPGEIGLAVAADTGRVWLEGEDSNVWHRAWGGGVFFAAFKRLMMFDIGFGKSREKTFFVMQGNITMLQF